MQNFPCQEPVSTSSKRAAGECVECASAGVLGEVGRVGEDESLLQTTTRPRLRLRTRSATHIAGTLLRPRSRCRNYRGSHSKNYSQDSDVIEHACIRCCCIALTFSGVVHLPQEGEREAEAEAKEEVN